MHHLPEPLTWTLLTAAWLGLSACATAQTGPTAAPPRQLEGAALDAPQEDPAQALELPIEPARARLEAAHTAGADQATQAAYRPALQAARQARAGALGEVDALFGSVWRAPLGAPHYSDILAAWQAPRGPLSVGTTSRGELLGAAELSFEGPHHVIIDRARPRGTQFGHPTMIRTIRDAGRHVAQDFPGSRLAVGNIAYEKGGDIRWSVSHNSGRDADLAFYVKDAATGERVADAPDLIEFGPDGRAIGREDLVFDVARNWALARALLTHPEAQVQYLFISMGLKAQLLAHAEALGEPDELIAHAEQVLKQPTDSSPHNDHFHLRLTCDLADRLRGCVDRGPRWDWVDWHDDALLAHTLAMAPALEDPAPEVRLAALDYVRAIEAPAGPAFALSVGMRHPDPEVRARALEVASSSWTFDGAAVAAMQHLIAHTDQLDDDARAQLYSMMRRSKHELTAPFVRDRLLDAAVPPEEKVWATRALAHHMDRDLVPFLMDQLRVQPAPVRAELALILRRITNRAEDIDWATADPEARQLAHARWTRWWDTHRGLEREVWVDHGFASIGLEPAFARRPSAIDPMLAALPRAPDHLVYNINRTLREITGRWAPLEQRDGHKLRAYWQRWWRKHRRRLLAES